MFIQECNFGNELTLRCGHKDGIHNSGDHLHRNFEIELVLEGEIEISVDGEKHVARAGDIAIIPPFRVHAFYTPKHVKMLICVFSPAFLTDFLSFRELSMKRERSVFHASEELWKFLVNSGFYENTNTKLEFDIDKDRNYIHHCKDN